MIIQSTDASYTCFNSDENTILLYFLKKKIEKIFLLDILHTQKVNKAGFILYKITSKEN